MYLNLRLNTLTLHILAKKKILVMNFHFFKKNTIYKVQLKIETL